MQFLSNVETDAELSTFLTVSGLNATDAQRLSVLSAGVLPLLPELTERFYAQLQSCEAMRPHLDGRIDQLKKTHLAWLHSLFSGVYDERFLAAQQAIGAAHVKAKVPPLFVSSSMSFLRAQVPFILTDELLQTLNESRADCTCSILRVLDLSHYLIDGAYFRQVMDVMGISRALLDRLMTV